MASVDERTADALNRFLDQQTGNGAGASGQEQDPLEESLVRTIQRLHVHDDAPPADPAFADRLLEEIMATSAHPAISPDAFAAGSVSRNGRLSHWMAPLAAPREVPRSRRAFGHLATAALVVLVLAASLFALRPGRQSGREDIPAIIPAIVGTPATPDTADVPVAEFVWETRGGPDVPFEDKPYAVTVDPDGNLWVLDGRRHQFQVFAPDGTYLESWGTPGSGPGEFNFLVQAAGNWPSGDIEFDQDGSIYVSDPGNFRVQKFGPDRAFIAAWGSEGDEDGQFRWPGEVEVDDQGRVYVPDEFRHDVQVFDRDGQYVRTIGGQGREDGQFDMPIGLALDTDGQPWVADLGRYRVQQFSPEGEFQTAWGKRGIEPGELLSIGGLEIDDRNRFFIANGGGEKIQIFAPDGTYLGAWGGPGTDPGEFFGIAGVVLDGQGNAFVSDFSNERIQKFRLLPPFGPGEEDLSAATREVLIDSDVPNMPGGYVKIMVDQWFFPAEPGSVPFPASQRGPTIVVAPGDSLVATIEGAPQALESGVPVVIPTEGSLSNSGVTEATAFTVGFAQTVSSEPSDPGVYPENVIEAPTEAIPAGPANVVLERITLPVDGSFPAYVASGLEWVGVGPGNLGVTMTGDGESEWTSGKERRVSAQFSAPRLSPGWEVTLRNTGDATIEVYRLRVTPLNPATPVADA